MLRISIQDRDNEMTLKVEGKLVGPWIEELDREWHNLAPFPPKKKLCLDLRGMTFADSNGVEALRKVWRSTGAEILADTPLTRDFARMISWTKAHNKNAHNRNKENP